MRYCTRCGRLQSGNDRFCTECGTPFGPQPDQRPAQPAQPPGFGSAGQAGGGQAGAGQAGGGAWQPGAPPSGPPQSGPPPSGPLPSGPPQSGPPQYGPRSGGLAGDPLDSLFRPYPSGPQTAGTGGGRPVPAQPGYAPGGTGSGPPQQQRPGSDSRRILVAVGVLVLLAAGGTGAWLGLRHSPSAARPASAASPARPHTTAPPAASATPASTPPATPTASATHGAAAGLVAVSPGVARTGTEPQVVAFLNNYFRAINTHDYQRYSALLGPRVRQAETAPVFRAGYRTTSDSAVTLTGISAAGAGRVAAGVTFISHQAAADSPSHSRCTDWNILLVLAKQHGTLLLQPPLAGYHASFRAC